MMVWGPLLVLLNFQRPLVLWKGQNWQCCALSFPAWLSNVVTVAGFDILYFLKGNGDEMTWRSPGGGWDGSVSWIKSYRIRCKCHSGYCGHPMLPYYESTQIPLNLFYSAICKSEKQKEYEWVNSTLFHQKSASPLLCLWQTGNVSMFHTFISLPYSALSPVAWKGSPEGQGGN